MISFFVKYYLPLAEIIDKNVLTDNKSSLINPQKTNKKLVQMPSKNVLPKLL